MTDNTASKITWKRADVDRVENIPVDLRRTDETVVISARALRMHTLTINTSCRSCIHWRQVIFHALDKKGAAVILFWPTQLPGQIVWLLRARGFDARHEDGFIKGKLDNNDWQFAIA